MVTSPKVCLILIPVTHECHPTETKSSSCCNHLFCIKETVLKYLGGLSIQCQEVYRGDGQTEEEAVSAQGRLTV